MDGEKSFGQLSFYCNSKLYQNYEKQFGYDNQGYFNNDGDMLTILEHRPACAGFAKKAVDCGATTIKAAVDLNFQGRSDIYLDVCKIKSPSSLSRNTEKQELLMKYTLDVVKDYLPPYYIHDYLDF
ncbi:hypothetical protein LOTGIDRAFT_172697 [Lottia gigantea]|uniref:Uncharacterized protein n=1 Tax=Lottia gigantea TaxID=225164 RepID=V4AAZ7_LOTGI|nr:hypothetical protein LOTGIDRAFT_172697 [Lottia gigantea]ESP01174.1 hypothetical protein LOTGIDRAFT_172697 [Lottia gigantea]